MKHPEFWVWILSTICVLSWIPLAHQIQVLTPNQMLDKYPKFDQVIPLVVESYFWADLLILSPLLGYAVSTIAGKWSFWPFALMSLVGLVAGVLFQKYVIVPGKYPSSLGGAGHTTKLGTLHIFYFGAAVALLLMFLFTKVSTTSVLIVWAGLALLGPADILVPTHFIKKIFGFPWIPDIFAEEKRLYYMITVVESGVAALAGLKIAFQ